MTFRLTDKSCPVAGGGRRRSGASLVEVMVGLAIGGIVLAIVAALMVAGARSFVVLGNYCILDQQSRLGVDYITREVRQATAVLAYQASGSNRWIEFTNAIDGEAIRYAWDATSRELISRKSGDSADVVVLDGCDNWEFEVWQRTPQPNPTNAFHAAASPALCKLVSMRWRCSRTALRELVNTEITQTAMIVLRNQQSN